PREPFAASVGSVASSIHLAFAGLFAVSERDGHLPVFARERAWARPGAVRGFLLTVALLAVMTLGWFGLYRAMGGSSTQQVRSLLAAPLFVVLYLSIGVLLGRVTPLRFFGEPIATRAGVALGLVAGTGVPMFLAVLSGQQANEHELNVLSPLLGLAGINNGSR